MNILIPMAGEGRRFQEQGYTTRKPLLPVTDRKTGKAIPMVVAAVADLPAATQNPLFILRDASMAEPIRSFYPQSQFITVDSMTEGQACTCLLAEQRINNDTPLFIAACDNGMELTPGSFDAACVDADAVIFTFRHNDAVIEKPQAYGWVKTDGDRATGVSVKIPISATPMQDHAIAGSFWFRRGADFVTAANEMIAANDRINNEFYVDQLFNYLITRGLKVKVLEVAHYVCWGTPADYEAYERTIAYWKGYLAVEEWAQ